MPKCGALEATVLYFGRKQKGCFLASPATTKHENTFPRSAKDQATDPRVCQAYRAREFVKSCSVSVYYGYTIYGSYLETNELVDVSDWKKNARSKNKEYQHKSALGERHYSFGGNFQIGDNVPSASRFQNIPSKI